jgi:hypothetical protein
LRKLRSLNIDLILSHVIVIALALQSFIKCQRYGSMLVQIVRKTHLLKVGANIRADHYAKGFTGPHEKRKNHEDNRVWELLAVPQYADILECGAADEEGNDGETPKSTLVTSASAWRRELAKWVEEEREDDSEDDTDEPGGASTSGGHRVRPWLPCSLATLFTGESKQPPRQRRQPFDHEALLMELLAAEHDSKEPDDGALEGSGDDYEA